MGEKEQTEPPHGPVVYAGVPVSGSNGIGLWCSVCGIGLMSIYHSPTDGEVRGIHQAWRVPEGKCEKKFDTWVCVIQRGRMEK